MLNVQLIFINVGDTTITHLQRLVGNICNFFKDDNKYNIRLRKGLVKSRIPDYGNFQCITYNTTENQVLACTGKGYLAIFKSSRFPEADCQFLPKVFTQIVKIEKRGIVVVKDCDGSVNTLNITN